MIYVTAGLSENQSSTHFPVFGEILFSSSLYRIAGKFDGGLTLMNLRSVNNKKFTSAKLKDFRNFADFASPEKHSVQ